MSADEQPSSPAPIKLVDVAVIGDNRHGYTFCVARAFDRWVGYAASDRMIFFFPEIAEGHELGVPDRDRAVLLTGAIAQDPENAYGGVERWFVPEHLRGWPEDFRCALCGSVGCSGVCANEADYDPEVGP